MVEHRETHEIVVIWIVVAVVVVIGIAAFWPFQSGRTRAPVSIVLSDQRTLATAIESYYVDHGAYPAWNTDFGNNAFHLKDASRIAAYRKLPTFAIPKAGEKFATLTTPVAYISAYFKDPLAEVDEETYCYLSTGKGWIMWSPGPDRKFDLTIDNIGQAYVPDERSPNAYLNARTYDPTNGTKSPGDVYRIKE